MIDCLSTEDLLRLLAKYYPVYQILWAGPTKLTDIKHQLMDFYEMAESTARSYINAIVADEAGPLWVDGDNVVSVNEDEVIEIEEMLQDIFHWHKFDPRHDAYTECHKKQIETDLKNQDLHHMLEMSYADRKKYEKQTKKQIEQLKAALQDKDLEIEDLNKLLEASGKKLEESERRHDETKKKLGETLRLSAWKFLGYRICFRLFNGEKRLQKEGL